MYGWAGQTLRVDLSSGELVTEPLDYNLRKEYIGGRGINSKIAYDEIKPGTDPLSPENVLIVGTGPLAGTLAPSGCKLNITAMSPLTNILGYSNVGGEFAPSLKWAGYDHIIIKGKSSEPVYLWIDDDRVELQSAKHLWGKSTAETVRMVREEFQDPTVELLTLGFLFLISDRTPGNQPGQAAAVVLAARDLGVEVFLAPLVLLVPYDHQRLNHLLGSDDDWFFDAQSLDRLLTGGQRAEPAFFIGVCVHAN